MVGVYRTGVNHGFVLANEFSNFITIDFPGAVATRALGINSCGDIVGTNGSVAAGTGHGFLLGETMPNATTNERCQRRLIRRR